MPEYHKPITQPLQHAEPAVDQTFQKSYSPPRRRSPDGRGRGGRSRDTKDRDGYSSRRSRSRSRDRSRRDRDRSRERRERDERRTRDERREKEQMEREQRERENREKERMRRKQGLPPIRPGHVISKFCDFLSATSFRAFVIGIVFCCQLWCLDWSFLSFCYVAVLHCLVCCSLFVHSMDWTSV